MCAKRRHESIERLGPDTVQLDVETNAKQLLAQVVVRGADELGVRRRMLRIRGEDRVFFGFQMFEH